MSAVVQIPVYCARQTARLFIGHSPEAHRQRALQSVAPAVIFGAQGGGGFVVVAAYACPGKVLTRLIAPRLKTGCAAE